MRESGAQGRARHLGKSSSKLRTGVRDNTARVLCIVSAIEATLPEATMCRVPGLFWTGLCAWPDRAPMACAASLSVVDRCGRVGLSFSRLRNGCVHRGAGSSPVARSDITQTAVSMWRPPFCVSVPGSAHGAALEERERESSKSTQHHQCRPVDWPTRSARCHRREQSERRTNGHRGE